MTPFIKETVNWMSKTIDPIEFQWFDVSSSMFDDEYLDTECIKKYRPPFPKCMVVFNSRKRNVSIYLTISGDDPSAGIIVSAWIGQKNKKITGIPPLIYCVEDSAVSYTSLKDEVIVTKENADMILSFVSGFYASLEKESTAYIPEVKDTFTNRRKIAEGKKPMYEWRTVTIEPQKERSIHQGGTHASPRLHDRRGHLRTLQSGKQVWVRSCKVGKAELGTIFHDYEVRA